MRNITGRNPAMDSRDIEDGIMALLKDDKEMAAVLFDRGFTDGPMRHRIARAIRNAA